MQRSVFSLAVLMGTILSAQVREEIPLEPPANVPVATPAPESDKAETPAVDELPAPDLESQPVADSAELTAPLVVKSADEDAATQVQSEVKELPLQEDGKQADVPSIRSPDLHFGTRTPAPRYERSLADRVVPRNNDRWDRVRLNAQKRAARRRFRIATMKWINYSKIRPVVGATPTTSIYTPRLPALRLDTSDYWDTLVDASAKSTEGQDQ